MRPDFGDEFKLDGKDVRIIAEDVNGNEIVVMDFKTGLTQRIDRHSMTFRNGEFFLEPPDDTPEAA